MEVRIAGGEEIAVFRPETRAFADQDVTLDTVRIELRGEEIALIRRAECCAPVARQTRWRDARKLGHHRHQIACTLELIHRRMAFGIHAPFDEMEERVTFPIFRIP